MEVFLYLVLLVHSCKLFNNKYMIALTMAVQITQIWDGSRIYVVILGFNISRKKQF